MQGKVTILGSGGSMGVPVVGCDCPVCQSSDPLNKRLRPSIAIEVAKKTLLFDCGPDFRAQAIANTITHIDALFLTHTHFDHIAGLDDLRIFCLRSEKPLPCLLSHSSYEDLQKRYYYLFENRDSSVVRLDFHIFPGLKGVSEIFGIPFRYFPYRQNSMEITGFRLGEFAYVTDIKQYDETLFEELQDIQYLILSMQKTASSNAHLSLEDVVAFQKRVKPHRIYITHMGHDIDYHTLKKELPAGIEPAHDGLFFTFEL